MTENKEYTEIINIIENQRWDKLKYMLSSTSSGANIYPYNSNKTQMQAIFTKQNLSFAVSLLKFDL